MMALWGILTAAGGAFLFLWYRTVVSLPVKRQPYFVQNPAFKWGGPAASLAVFLAGLTLTAAASLPAAAIAAAACLLAGFAVIRFDRYSASMRILFSRYNDLRLQNPDLETAEVLFHLARRRYPQWSHDRLVELVAGKDIENLILLMILNENQVNPLMDWELYRSLKFKAAQIVRTGKSEEK
jgi:hypothetical protein